MSKGLVLYDSMVGDKVVFDPIDINRIGMYGCGMTVYSKPHIGNLRSVLVYDLLYRTLSELYPKVVYVRNITDVDDKIIAASAKEGCPIEDIVTKYSAMFHSDVERLFCLPPTFEPRATAFIGNIIQIIESILNNKHAYIASDGVYFKVDSFQEYGHLSRRKLETQIAGARVAVGNNKKNHEDFALWKLYEDGSVTWPSPWGQGRPGWHIECSAMAYEALGTDFDIHCGGEDLKFPHHENEIAQSKCAFSGSGFAKYWLHVAFVTFNGEKMSKSISNVCYLDDIITARINTEVVRLGLLSTHYRKPLNLSGAIFDNARDVLDKMYDVLLRYSALLPRAVARKHPAFWTAILDDMNTPQALVEMHALVKMINTADNDDHRLEGLGYLLGCGKFLGLFNHTPEQWFNIEVDYGVVQDLLLQRIAARSSGDYALADALRSDLLSMGVEIRDNPDGSCSFVKKH